MITTIIVVGVWLAFGIYAAFTYKILTRPRRPVGSKRGRGGRR